VIATSGWVALKASATACEIGWTVDEPEMLTSPVSAAADVASDPGAGADAPVEAAVLGAALVPGLLQALNATTAANASAPRRFEPEIVTKALLSDRARARDCCSLRNQRSRGAFNEGFVAR
jgi:hypothetical protein